MSDNDLWFEEPGDELRDEEYPCDEDDEYSDDDTCTVACPQCRAEVYEDAVRCSHCGNYITHDTRVWSGRPWWWIVLGLLGVLATIFTLAGWYPW